MEQELIETATGLIEDAESVLHTISAPWTVFQLGLVLGLVVLAQLLHMIAAPRLEAWVRGHDAWRGWRLRLAVIVLRRLRGVFFLLLISAAVWIMYEAAPPERSQILGTIARIYAAWLVVSFAAQLIRYPPLRRIVMFGAAVYIGLFFLAFWTGRQRSWTVSRSASASSDCPRCLC